ncbi:Glyoxylate reductase [Acidilobus saccharovorans 345-15]|uniref:Glyoxylate reductase n=1 Tax=Acidilobus saccharovorans (strain DSM 16705 / JCM 18335 / VKM B-2471 / 345-15) TaxID=666510 RepID=D9PZN9_ACIS3|nr:glyoxylate reductase [Acidilobus saccharovorans]ADL18527.1 Glyoxylate reductase [Acidilobus saccharovorans 345-15]
MELRLFVTREIPFPAFESIKGLFQKVDVWPEYRPPTKEELISRAKGAQALVTMLEDKVTCDVIEALSPELRIIAQYAVGFDNIDLECATKHGVYVTNTPDVLTDATADLTWALILAVARRIVESDAYVRSGGWKSSGTAWHPTMMLGFDLVGKTLGIVGGGRIGQAVARRAKGFDMRIIYNSRRRHPEMEALGATYVDLDELFRESDIVTLHVPLTPETQNLVNESRLRLMKRTAIVVNTARGKVVDIDALYRALKEGWIAGAGLDVYPTEPLDPSHPITKLSNVVLTPHIGSATRETRAKMAELVYRNLEAFSRGERPPTLVNEEVLRVRPPGF